MSNNPPPPPPPPILGESGEQPSLNNSSQLRQSQKTMGLLTGDCSSLEEYSMLKSHESMVENH